MSRLWVMGVGLCCGIAWNAASGALYVALSGDDSTGADWSRAYTNLQTAVNVAGPGEVIYVKADTFTRVSPVDLSGKINVTISGGYAGTSPEPGPLAAGPSRFVRGGVETRLFYGQSTTVTVERLWIQGGWLTAIPSYGAGLYFDQQSQVLIRDCVITNNQCSVQGTQEGGGLYINSGQLRVENSAFVANALPKASWPTASRGGALAAVNTQVVLSNSLFRSNYVHSRHNNSFGGAVYVLGGSCEIVRSTFETNWAQGDTYDTADNGQDYGGALHFDGVGRFGVRESYFAGNYCVGRGSTRRGDVLYVQGSATGSVVDSVAVLNGYNNSYGGEAQLYVAGGTVGLTNVLVARGYRGHGIQVNGASASVSVNCCTLATNPMYGVTRTVGGLTVRNSVVWDNGAGGLNAPDAVDYTLSQEVWMGSSNLVADPWFADRIHFHLQSRAGAYTNGFWGGGSWLQSGADSPALDSADPTAPYGREPEPNGFRAERGAYGNSATASKTYLEDPGVFTVLTAFAHPAVPLSLTSARLRGQVLSAGGAGNPQTFLCWGPTDGGVGGTSGWANAIGLGARGEWEFFTHDVTGLTLGVIYQYRALATNGAGSDWSAVVSFGAQTTATVANLGVYRVQRTAARLRGQVVQDGGAAPQVWFWHWADGGAVTSITALGTYLAGQDFSLLVSNLTPDTLYHYRIQASNTAGISWSAVADYTTLSTNPIGRYVTVQGAGIFDGTSWADAYVGIDNALADCTLAGDTIYLKVGTYVRSSPVDVSRLGGVTIRGGYAGLGTPGAVTSGPTVIARDPDRSIRLVYGAATTVTLDRVTVSGGYLTAAASGVGLFFTSNSTVTISNSHVMQNTSQGAGQMGVGLFMTGGVLRIVDSIFSTNSALRVDSGDGGQGGGIGAATAEVMLDSVLFVGNRCHTRHRGSQGGGLYLSRGTATVIRCRFEMNDASNEGNSDSPGPARGGAIAGSRVERLDIRDCTFISNRAYATVAPIGGIRQGGALYLYHSTASVGRCVMIREGHVTDPYGVIYAEGGAVGLTNVLVAGGRSGNGVYGLGGSMRIESCTVVSNGGWGICGDAATQVRNSIAWDNATGGISNGPAINYTCSQEAQSGEKNIQMDPLFVDNVYYHLQSRDGHYEGGYFNGGSWSRGLDSSPCIDAGDPSSPRFEEPEPNGGQINLGCYGNTPVASKSPERAVVVRIF